MQSNPRAAAADAPARAELDWLAPVVTIVSIPSATARPRTKSNLRILLPANATPCTSSRLIQISASRAAPNRSSRSTGVGQWPSPAFGRARSFANEAAALVSTIDSTSLRYRIENDVGHDPVLAPPVQSPFRQLHQEMIYAATAGDSDMSPMVTLLGTIGR